ncbi:MAG TPA: TerB family tellurite resistance protein [Vicinamibacterales bacterium]|nr:TerB family tellurite resistance protein [Vicinamibacterales bacterium]
MPDSPDNRDAARTPPGWSADAAKAFLVIAVTAVDGSFGVDEIDAIKPTLGSAGLSAAAADEALRQALSRYRECLAGNTLEGALRACAAELKAALGPADRRAFLTHLVSAALADDRFERTELAFLESLGAVWEL